MEVSNETKHYQPKPQSEVVDPLLSAREQSLASSLLNLSAEDWQEFIDEDHGGDEHKKVRSFASLYFKF